MKLHWKNRELDEVDVLAESELSAYIAIDKEVAIIFDDDSNFFFSDEIKEIIEDESKEFFEIVFSPERVICGMDFLFMSSEEKEEAIEAIGVFKDTFLSTVLDIAKAKGDMVRAEVIRLVWSKFNRNGSIQPIECNQEEVQRFVRRYETEKGLQEQRGVISSIWRELISLILKYAIYLVTWEKCEGESTFAEEKGEFKKETNENLRNAKKSEFKRRYKKCYDMVDITDKALERYAKRSEANMYRCLQLTWDDRMKEYRKFFYASHKFKQKSQKGKRNISTTLLGYYFIWEVDEFSHYDKKTARTELFNRGIEKPQLVDCNNKVCRYLSSSIEIVMMNISQINMAEGFISNESVEKEEFLKELDSLQIRVMPFVYVNSSKGNEERLNVDLVEQLVSEAMEKQNEFRKELCKTDGYEILGGREIFSGIGRTGMTGIAEEIWKEAIKREADNLAKARVRKYWQNRKKNLTDACYKKNYEYFDLTTLSNKERSIAVYFDQYVDEQKRCISQEITAILEDAKAKVEK